jgi:hypothetical protein
MDGADTTLAAGSIKRFYRRQRRSRRIDPDERSGAVRRHRRRILAGMNSLRRARRTVAWFRTGSARSAHWAMLLGIVAPSRAPAHPQTAQLCAVRAAEFQKFIKAERAVRETSAAQVRIACPREAPRPTIFLAYPSEYPPDTFYDFLAAVVGRASQQSAEQTRLRAHRCHRQARRTSFGRAVKVFDSFRLECERHRSRSSFTFVWRDMASAP